MIDLLSERSEEVMCNNLFNIIESILQYFDNKEEDECDANQYIVGMRHLFCRHAIKAWKGADFSISKYYRLNKMLVRHCVLCYKQC